MRDNILDWLNSNQNQRVDTNDTIHRLTINPENDFVFIKYWEPSPVKDTDFSIWKIVAEIKISPEFLNEYPDHAHLSEILLKKLELGGNYEITNEG